MTINKKGAAKRENVTGKSRNGVRTVLQSSEANFRNSMENSPLGIRIVSEDGETLYANRAFLNIYGYKSLKEFQTTPVKDRYTPDSYIEFRERREKRRRQEPLPENYEVSILRKNGEVRHLQVIRKGILWGGKPQYQTIYQDITAQKQVEEALKASEVRYRRLFEAAKDGILIIDAVTGLITDVNPFLNNLLGLSLKEIKGKQLWEIGTFADIVSSKERFEELRQKGYVRYEDLPLKTVDGRQISVEFVSNVYDVDHRKVIQCNIRDISEHKRAEEALRTSEERYRLIVEKSNDVIFTFNAAGEFTYISPSIKNMLGYNPSGLIGQVFSSLVHPEDIPHLQQAIQRNIKDGSQTPGGIEYRIHRASGEWRWLNASGNAVYDANGKFVNFVGVARDITERKQITTRLDELHKTMQLVTDIDQLIVKIDDESELLQQACNEFVKSRKYPLAWIGFNQEGSYDILPSIKCGEKTDYLAKINVTWDDSRFSKGPTGTAIKTGKLDVMRDMAHDPRYEPWRERALKSGFNTSVAFPLVIQDKVIGALTIYSESVEAFNKDELDLLGELAGDLSLGIEKIRSREEQLKLEEALRLSEQNFRNSLDSSLMGIRIVDAEWHTLYANHVFLDMFGFKNINEVGRYALQDRYTTEEKTRHAQRMEKRQRGESVPDNPKVDIIGKDGTILNIMVYSNEVLWDGKPQRQLIYLDITERQKAEDALTLSEQNFRNSLDSSLFGIRVVDVHGQTLYANQALLDIFGYANFDDIKSNPPQEQFTPEGYEGYTLRKDKRLRGESIPDKVDIDIVRKDGAVRHLQVFPKDVLWNGKQELQIYYQDVTGLKQAEEARKLSEQNFRNSLDSSLIGIRIVYREGRNLYLNQTFLDLFGYEDSAEVEASPPQEHYTPESNAAFIRRGEIVAQGGTLPDNYEIDVVRKDGAIRHLQLFRKEVLWDGKHEFQILYNDITERVQAEVALQRSEENFRNTLDTSLMGIFIGDSGNVIYVNRAFLEMFGYDNLDEVRAVKPAELYSPESYARYLERRDRQQRGEPNPDNFEVDVVRKDGSLRNLQVFRKEVLWNGQQRSQLLYNDVTALKQAEEERQKIEDKAQVASRLAVVGEMAAGIAHEINNPLTGVLGFSQMMLEKESLPEEIKAELRLIVDGSQRVADIVKRLLTFARQTKPIKTMTNINELIDNTLKLREYVLRTANIALVTGFDPELPWSIVDPGQLQQVFLNLIVNAEQAMKSAHGRGTLTVTTVKKGNNIFISFRDDGPGITPENRKRLFEPFFTTKAPGEGTGLGLSLSRSIILEHNGKMEVESEFGRGANFIIELPIIESLSSEADVQLTPVKSKPNETKRGKILVVDDEPGVRILLEKILTQMGYTVDTIADAEAAVEKLDVGATYNVILTDVRMPGMSGIELHSYILEKIPAMKNSIIFITGDVMGSDIKDFLMKNNLPFFPKPFDIEALKEKINSMIMAGPSENGGAKRSNT